LRRDRDRREHAQKRANSDRQTPRHNDTKNRVETSYLCALVDQGYDPARIVICGDVDGGTVGERGESQRSLTTLQIGER
jgi:hypothetical protein